MLGRYVCHVRLLNTEKAYEDFEKKNESNAASLYNIAINMKNKLEIVMSIRLMRDLIFLYLSDRLRITLNQIST